MNVPETREQLEKRMDEAARKYAETHDEKYKEELLELAPTNRVHSALT